MPKGGITVEEAHAIQAALAPLLNGGLGDVAAQLLLQYIYFLGNGSHGTMLCSALHSTCNILEMP